MFLHHQQLAWVILAATQLWQQAHFAHFTSSDAVLDAQAGAAAFLRDPGSRDERESAAWQCRQPAATSRSRQPCTPSPRGPWSLRGAPGAQPPPAAGNVGPCCFHACA